jgi:hypothetical protein
MIPLIAPTPARRSEGLPHLRRAGDYEAASRPCRDGTGRQASGRMTVADRVQWDDRARKEVADVPSDGAIGVACCSADRSAGEDVVRRRNCATESLVCVTCWQSRPCAVGNSERASHLARAPSESGKHRRGGIAVQLAAQEAQILPSKTSINTIINTRPRPPPP